MSLASFFGQFAQFGQFHFLRPAWLVALVFIVPFWWAQRRRADARHAWRGIVEPRLLDALLLGTRDGRGFMPAHLVIAMIALLAVSAAGPAWQRAPSGDGTSQPPLVIALSLEPGMLATDVAPSRLERAKQKIRDLLAARGEARNALIVYGGEAYKVVPMTDDASLFDYYLADLQPDLLPREGNAPSKALALGAAMLSREAAGGAVLLIASALPDADLAEFRKAKAGSNVLLLLVGRDEGTAGFDSKAARRFADATGIAVTRVTATDGDVTRIVRDLRGSTPQSGGAKSDAPWRDMSFVVLIPALLLGVFWFRRGWRVRWSD
jgi:Ca-activated chloride channel homolog